MVTDRIKKFFLYTSYSWQRLLGPPQIIPVFFEIAEKKYGNVKPTWFDVD